MPRRAFPDDYLSSREPVLRDPYAPNPLPSGRDILSPRREPFPMPVDRKPPQPCYRDVEAYRKLEDRTRVEERIPQSRPDPYARELPPVERERIPVRPLDPLDETLVSPIRRAGESEDEFCNLFERFYVMKQRREVEMSSRVRDFPP